MSDDILLTGLDSLMTVCQRHSLPSRLFPPLASAPRPGASLFGEPLDPQLAVLYQRTGGAELGPVTLYPPGPEPHHLLPWNQWLRRLDDAHFGSSLIFGQKTGFSLYFATIPRMADSQGLQPVVYIEAVDIFTCVPVASSVNQFFHTYSRYLELMVKDPEYIASGVPEASFPWSVPDLITQDPPLMAQARAGHFDFLAQEDDDAYRWLQQLCAEERR